MTKDPDDTDELPLLRNLDAPAPAGESSWVEVDIAAISHPGRVRSNNEDHYFVARIDRSLQTLHTNLRAGEIPEDSSETAYGLLVADGVGGAVAGEVTDLQRVGFEVRVLVATADQAVQVQLTRNEVRTHGLEVGASVVANPIGAWTVVASITKPPSSSCWCPIAWAVIG